MIEAFIVGFIVAIPIALMQRHNRKKHKSTPEAK